MSLLKATQLSAIRKIGLQGMTTSVAILRLSKVESIYGVDSVYTLFATVSGWVDSRPTPMITVVSGAQAVVNTYRLYLPVGTDIRTGDRATIGAETYTVSDTDAESTWLPMLTVTLRKVE